MGSRDVAFVIVFALVGGLSHAGQDRRATVVGVVRDTGGRALPGATVSVTLGAGDVKSVTDAQGRYSLSLPAGSHTIHASLAGFCTAEEYAQLTPGATSTVNIHLRLGPLRMIDWVAPPERLSELVASAHTVAHVRVTGTEPVGKCQQAAPVTSTVVDALKPPGLAAGADLIFWQEQWHSEPTPYPVGTELVVLLIEWNDKLVRSHGPHAVFRVTDGTIQGSPFLSQFYRGYVGMPVAQFLAKLRTMRGQ